MGACPPDKLEAWCANRNALDVRRGAWAEGNVAAAKVAQEADVLEGHEVDQFRCWFADAAMVADVADNLLKAVHAEDRLRADAGGAGGSGDAAGGSGAAASE